MLQTQRGSLVGPWGRMSAVAGALCALALVPVPARHALAAPRHVDRFYLAADPIAYRIERVIPVGADPSALTVDGRTGRVFVVNRLDSAPGHASHAGTVSVVDPARGVVQCTVAVGLNPLAVVMDARTRRVFVLNVGSLTQDYVHFPSGSVSVLDVTCTQAQMHARPSGSPDPALRTVTVGYAPRAVAVDERLGHVFVINGDALRVLDGASGAVLRTTATGYLGEAISAIAVDSRSGRVFLTNYDPSTVSILAATSGQVLRALRVGSRLGPVAVDTRTGRVFVVNLLSQGGRVSVLDETGTLLRTTTVDNFPRRILADERAGRVFVLNDQSVSVLDARTGALLRTSVVGQYPVAMAVDTRGGFLFVVDAKGTDVLDATTGVVLGTLPVGQHSAALTVDEHTGRVFVAEKGPAGGRVVVLTIARRP